MSDSKNLGLRDSRDRIVDLLGIGETYPLRDLGVSEELVVPFHSNARLIVSDSQRQVRYELRDHAGHGPEDRPQGAIERIDNGQRVEVAGDGNGAALLLLTPAADEDITFTVLASKRHPRPGDEDSVRAVYLRQQTRIKVGLDTQLAASVPTDAEGVTYLDPNARGDSDARIISYGSTVTIAIVGAQEGVDYDLVSINDDQSLQLRSPEKTRGKGEQHTITILSSQLYEDVDLRVRATKSFSLAEARDTEVSLLEAILPLRVLADSGSAVTATPVTNYGEASTVRITTTQKSTRYQLFIRDLRDREFAAKGDASHLAIPLGEAAHAYVQRPPWSQLWSKPADFQAIGDELVGNGGALDLPIPVLTRDTLIIVRARKSHRTAGDLSPIESTVQLKNPAATLVAPDPAPTIELRVALQSGKTRGYIDILDGQPGVYYHLRNAPDGGDIGLPAYIHQRDDIDLSLNKGIGQLAVGVDLTLARDPEAAEVGARASQAPPPPRVDTPALNVGDVLYLHAVKAMTGIGVALSKSAEITTAPTITAQQPTIAAGEHATLVIASSTVGQRYQLLQNDPVGEPVEGTGEDLSLVSAAIDEPTVLVVEITRPAASGLRVRARVEIAIAIATT